MRDVHQQIDKCTNKAIAQWIKQLHTEAIQKKKRSAYIYERLLRSVVKYPAPLASKNDFLVLDGCGDFMSHKIENFIRKDLRGKMELLHPCPIAREFIEREKALEQKQHQNRLLDKPKEYLDVLKLIHKKGALYIEEIDRMITLPKNVILRTMLEHLQHEKMLVKIEEKHILSKEAMETLNEIVLLVKEEHKEKEITEKQKNVSEYSTETWNGEECELCLVYDAREFRIGSDRLYAQERMKNEEIVFLEQQLPLGDFIWVVRQKEKNGQNTIGVLNFIVERKKGRDLVDSIKDGRFIEQKQRIKSSGFERGIYLVEEMADLGEVFGSELVASVVAKTRLKDNFHVVKASGIEETFDMLVEITKELKRSFLKKQISILVCKKGLVRRKDYLKESKSRSCDLVEYSLFSRITGKSFCSSVGEIFIKMLITIPSMTIEKALCLTAKYPTINSLRNGYLESIPGKRQNMLADLVTVDGKKIGKTLSKRVAAVFGYVQ